MRKKQIKKVLRWYRRSKNKEVVYLKEYIEYYGHYRDTPF